MRVSLFQCTVVNLELQSSTLVLKGRYEPAVKMVVMVSPSLVEGVLEVEEG